MVPAEPEPEPASIGIQVGPGSRVEGITVHGDVAGRDIVKVTEELTYDVSDLAHNPYLGLASYTYATAAFYGGRELQIGETVRRLMATADEPVLLFVTGASGSGKSSFVQAGLVPALEREYARHGSTVHFSVMRPGRHPVAALARALADLGLSAFASTAHPTAEEFNTLLSAETPPRQVNVIVLDQFEELFTQSDSAEREEMCAVLAGLDGFARVRSHFVATLRSDFLPALFDIPALFDRVKRHGVELRAMQRGELAQAIQRPLQEEARTERKDKRLDPALLERLIDDVHGDPTLLPLLQVTLRALWDEPPHKLILGRYQSLTHALEQHADQVYALDRSGRERTASERVAIMDIFLALVEVSLDDDARRDVRRGVPKTDLLQLHPERAGLIDELVDARLLATSAQSVGDLTVEMVDLIHETLLTNWSHLRTEIQARREGLQRSERFRIALLDWLEQQRSPDYLLQGVRLAEARQLAAHGDLGFRRLDAREFLAQSLAQAEQERERELEQARALAEEQRQRADVERQARKRQARFSAAIAVLAVAALLVAAVAVWQRSEADSQRAASLSRELALQAIVQLSIDPARSLVLATEAALTRSTTEAEDALRQALLQSHVRAVLTLPSGAITAADLSPDGAFAVTGGEQGDVRVWEIGGPSVNLGAHTGAVSSVAFSPDGRHIASAGYDNTARIWDRTRPAEPPVVLKGHTEAVVIVAYDVAGQRLLTGGLDGTVRIWDATSGAPLWTLSGLSAGVSSAIFDSSGDRVAAGSYDETVRVWDARTGHDLATLTGDQGTITGLAFSPDGQRLISTSYDQSVRVWNLANLSDVVVLRGHTDGIVSLDLSPDGKKILTASLDRTARIWNAANPSAPPTVLSGHAGALSGAVFSPDGTRVLTSSADRTARVWDAGTGKQLAVLRGHAGNVTSAKFGADGRQLLTVGDNTARVWEPTADQEVVALTGFRDAVTSLSFSPDGRQLLASGADGTAQVWDTATWTVHAVLTGHSDGIVSASFSSAGDTVLTASLDRTVGIWDPATGQQLRVLTGHSAALVDARFSPDGKRVLSASRDGTARLWDTRSGSSLHVFSNLPAAVTGVAFDPLGVWLVASTADLSAYIWDISSGNQLAMLSGHQGWLTGVVVDQRTGKIVTTSADGIARVWTPPRALPPVLLTGHAAMTTSASFSPDGGRVATASVDGTARIWSLNGGKPPIVLEGHGLPVWSVAFNPAGDMVVTAGDDGTARLWDATTGAQLVELHGHTGPVRSAVFSPDGRYVATAGRDGIVQIHFARLDRDLVNLAVRRLPPAGLQEVQPYVHDAFQQVAPTACAAPVYWAQIASQNPRLGCATFASSSDSTFQEFQHGLMLWRKDPSPSRIYVLSRYASTNGWEAYIDHSPDPYVSANPDPGCPEYRRRANGELASGFDPLWCEPWNWKLQLGEPTAEAQAGGHNLIQQFEHGSVFSLASGLGLILYADGTWDTFSP